MKMTWNEFQRWQSWEEFPERKNDPPFTADVEFSYAGKKYQIDHISSVNAKKQLQEGYYLWNVEGVNFIKIGYGKKFIDIIHMPTLDGKSFFERIEELDFDE